jgi:hypothetical protein
MNDDYKKGYADAMGWKIENHLEHLPEQAPMKWLKFNDKGDTFDNTPFYTTPPQRTWVGLTDEEIWEWFRDNTALTSESGKRIYQAIEAKLKEKNE